MEAKSIAFNMSMIIKRKLQVRGKCQIVATT